MILLLNQRWKISSEGMNMNPRMTVGKEFHIFGSCDTPFCSIMFCLKVKIK